MFRLCLPMLLFTIVLFVGCGKSENADSSPDTGPGTAPDGGLSPSPAATASSDSRRTPPASTAEIPAAKPKVPFAVIEPTDNVSLPSVVANRSVEGLFASNDGRYAVIFLSRPEDTNESRRKVLFDLAERKIVSDLPDVEAYTGSLTAVPFRPTGNQFMVRKTYDELLFVSVPGGEATSVDVGTPENPPNRLYEVGYKSDGSIAFLIRPGQIQLLNPDDGSIQAEVPFPESFANHETRTHRIGDRILFSIRDGSLLEWTIGETPPQKIASFEVKDQFSQFEVWPLTGENQTLIALNSSSPFVYNTATEQRGKPIDMIYGLDGVSLGTGGPPCCDGLMLVSCHSLALQQVGSATIDLSSGRPVVNTFFPVHSTKGDDGSTHASSLSGDESTLIACQRKVGQPIKVFKIPAGK